MHRSLSTSSQSEHYAHEIIEVPVPTLRYQIVSMAVSLAAFAALAFWALH